MDIDVKFKDNLTIDPLTVKPLTSLLSPALGSQMSLFARRMLYSGRADKLGIGS